MVLLVTRKVENCICVDNLQYTTEVRKATIEVEEMKLKKEQKRRKLKQNLKERKKAQTKLERKLKAQQSIKS